MRERLDAALAWHRREELPRYRAFLADVSARVRAPFAPGDAAAFQARVRAAYARLVEHELPDMADLLARLEPAQLAHLERRFREDDRKLLKDAARGTPESRREDAAARMTRHVEAWTGSLSRAQRAIVAAHVAAFPDVTVERLADRRYRQSEILALAREEDRDRRIAGLRRLLLGTDAWRRPEYRARLAEREGLAFEMLARLSATLTAGQRARLQSRIAGYRDDMARLSAH